jgi:hypothetical protein
VPTERDVINIFEVPDDSDVRTEYIVSDKPAETLQIDDSTTVRSNKRRRSNNDFDDSPRRTYRKRAAPSRPGFVRGEEVDEMFLEPEVSVKETVESIPYGLPRERENMERSIRPLGAAYAPVAPMGIGEQSESASQIPNLDTSVHQERARAFLKLKRLSQPKSQLAASSHATTTNIVDHDESDRTIVDVLDDNNESSLVPTPTSAAYVSPYLEQGSERSSSSFEIRAQNRPNEDSRPEQEVSRNQPSRITPIYSDTYNSVAVHQIPSEDRRMGGDGTLPELQISASVPEACLEVGREPLTKPNILTEPSKPANPKPRPSPIQLWVITRSPRYTQELCSSLKFQGSSLEYFTASIASITQSQNILEKIKLTLQTPKFDTKLTVYQDAEDAWVAAKEVLAENIRQARAEAKRQGKVANLKILIEPFYKESFSTNGIVDDEDEEVDF